MLCLAYSMGKWVHDFSRSHVGRYLLFRTSSEGARDWRVFARLLNTCSRAFFRTSTFCSRLVIWLSVDDEALWILLFWIASWIIRSSSRLWKPLPWKGGVCLWFGQDWWEGFLTSHCPDLLIFRWFRRLTSLANFSRPRLRHNIPILLLDPHLLLHHLPRPSRWWIRCLLS